MIHVIPTGYARFRFLSSCDRRGHAWNCNSNANGTHRIGCGA